MSSEHSNGNGSVESDDFVSLNDDMISGLLDRFGADMRVCVDRGPMMGVVTASLEHADSAPQSYERTYHRHYARHNKSHNKSYNKYNKMHDKSYGRYGRSGRHDKSYGRYGRT